MPYKGHSVKRTNTGKPVGNKGKKSKKGNRKTYQAADRYK